MTPTEMHIDALMQHIESLRSKLAVAEEALLELKILNDDANSILYHIAREALAKIREEG